MDKIDMGNGPLVSVIVPTYNRAGTVVKAIDSILCQSHPRLEVVIVDDGSSDNTSQVLRTAQQKDVRVVHYSNTRGKGCAGARNTGVSAARGEYIAFLDDDDEYLPDKIMKQLEVFAHNPRADVVVSGVPADWCENQSDTDWVSKEFHPNQVFASCYLMCKRAVLEDVTFRCNYMEWRDFAFQVYEKGFVVLLSSERLVQRSNPGGSLSKHKEAMFLSALTNAKRYYQCSRGRQEHAVFRGYLANCYKSIGNFSLKKGMIWSAIRGYANSFRVEKKIRNLIPFA